MSGSVGGAMCPSSLFQAIHLTAYIRNRRCEYWRAIERVHKGRSESPVLNVGGAQLDSGECKVPRFERDGVQMCADSRRDPPRGWSGRPRWRAGVFCGWRSILVTKVRCPAIGGCCAVTTTAETVQGDAAAGPDASHAACSAADGPQHSYLTCCAVELHAGAYADVVVFLSERAHTANRPRNRPATSITHRGWAARRHRRRRRDVRERDAAAGRGRARQNHTGSHFIEGRVPRVGCHRAGHRELRPSGRAPRAIQNINTSDDASSRQRPSGSRRPAIFPQTNDQPGGAARGAFIHLLILHSGLCLLYIGDSLQTYTLLTHKYKPLKRPNSNRLPKTSAAETATAKTHRDNVLYSNER